MVKTAARAFFGPKLPLDRLADLMKRYDSEVGILAFVALTGLGFVHAIGKKTFARRGDQYHEEGLELIRQYLRNGGLEEATVTLREAGGTLEKEGFPESELVASFWISLFALM